jgi:SAM-dependent methyltransferase
LGLADAAHVREQYGDATRLDTRVGLYERFARQDEPWYRWLLRQLGLVSGERILDVGAGSGGVWRENPALLPRGLSVALVDRSQAMLLDGRARGAPADLAAGADARALPFRDGTFDALLAAHMLYHVPERARAFGEMRRVLRRGGRLCIATNDWTHLIELRELAGRFGLGGALFAAGRATDDFALDAATDELSGAFGPVRVVRRRVLLEITEAAPAVDYVRSVLPEGGAGEEESLAAFGCEIDRRIERSGAFETVACAGVVLAES